MRRRKRVLVGGPGAVRSVSRSAWKPLTCDPGSRLDPQRAHHLVVLVLKDVAVPDEEPRLIETGLDAGDLVGVGDDRVLVTGLPRFGRPRCPANGSRSSTWNCTSWMWIG